MFLIYSIIGSPKKCILLSFMETQYCKLSYTNQQVDPSQSTDLIQYLARIDFPHLYGNKKTEPCKFQHIKFYSQHIKNDTSFPAFQHSFNMV